MTTWEIVKAVLLFLFGFVCLIKGGDWFVDGASGIAKRLKIPEIIIGATVVSIGTTLPEVMVSSSAALKGAGEIAYGNALGSIICNTSLIAALTIAVRPAKIERSSLYLPVFFFFGAMIFYALNAYLFGRFGRIAGIILLLIFCAYTALVITTQLRKRKKGLADPVVQEPEEEKQKPTPLWKEIVFLIIGAALIALGANLLVDNGTILAKVAGVPESVIALTFVALGTSLPELVTAITSLAKGHSVLSLGNIIGANLFNLVLVSGLSTTLSPYTIPMEKTLFGINASLIVDIPLCFAVMAILTVPALLKKKVMRWQGIALLVIYAAYLVFQFAL